MKRAFLFMAVSPVPLVAAGTGMIAATYGLIRLAYGLFLPDVQAELGLSVLAAGIVSAGASVVYCVGAVLGLVAATRHARALVVASALSAALGAVGMALAPDPGTFAVFAIASSAGAGLASPALVAVLQRHPATSRRPRAQEIVNAGTGPGLVAAGALALLLLPDWRLGWFIAAVFTVIVAGIVLVADRPAAGGDVARRPLPPASWFAAHRRVLVAALLLGVGSAAAWNYGRTLLVDFGVDEVVSVGAWIAIGVGGTAVIITARWTARLGPRGAWALTACTVAAASVSIPSAAGHPILTLTAFAVFGWGYVAASGALISWTIRIDRERAPGGTALLFITLILGQAIGAGVLGASIALTDHAVAFLAAALASAAAALPAFGRAATGKRERALPSAPAPSLALSTIESADVGGRCRRPRS